MKNCIFFPIHVWDREFDSRLLLAYINASIGLSSIIGHEYNMAPLYKNSEESILYRAGGAIDHPVRGEWHYSVKNNGGMVITQDEEGVNNMPLLYRNTIDSQSAVLDKQRLSFFRNKVSVKAVQSVDLMMGWSKMHRAYMSNVIEDIEARSIAINKMQDTSPVRFDLLGSFGKKVNYRLASAIQAIYSEYILVLDNFTVDSGGQKGLINPKVDLMHCGYSEKEADEKFQGMLKDARMEESARSDFASLIKQFALNNPNLNFVFRPHPVLNPSYWVKEFESIKNINIICKGSVQPWIYGATATLHSGCTTGLEAYGAGVKTIDVSNLISDRSSYIKASLIANSSQRVSTVKELQQAITSNHIYKDLIDDKYMEENPGDKDKSHTKSLEIIMENSNQVANRICAKLNLENASEVIGGDSAICCIFKNIVSKIGSKQGYLDNRKIQLLSESCYSYLPNGNKSRFVRSSEVVRRLQDFKMAFSHYGIMNTDIEVITISCNTFVIRPINKSR